MTTRFQLDPILNSAPVGIAVFDYGGLFEAVNPAYCAIYGYQADELLGASITTIFPVEMQERILQLHRGFLDQGTPLGGEWEVLRRDKSRLHVISNSVLVVDAAGQRLRFVYVTDISERRRMELELRASEQRLALVLRGTDDAVIDADLVSGQRNYSAKWWQMLGYPVDAWPLDGNHWQKLMHPEDREPIAAAFAAALAGNSDRFEIKMRMQHRDGQYRDILSRGYISRDATGRAIRYTGANTDLTDYLRIEREAQQFQALVESSDDAIISKSLNGTVTSWNAGAQAMFGYSAQEMLGQPISVLMPEDRVHEEDEILRRIRRGEKVRHFETVRRRKDGTSIHVSVTISPILDQQGQVIGASKIARDITPLLLHRQQLEYAAQHDHLTDLPNRYLFSDRLQQALVLARRQRLVLAIVYIDLDGFKLINDNYGHSAGDALLVTLTAHIKDALREVDTLARLGGDEFAAVLVDVQSLEDCKVLIQRVLLACAEPVPVGDYRVQVSASIGLTLYPADDAVPEQLLAHADQAMYQAKKAGKNQYCVFEPKPLEDALEDAPEDRPADRPAQPPAEQPAQ
jgi:diguanylate cyclase (GGDEF)-like protein/PAS domain S-box-containing protein